MSTEVPSIDVVIDNSAIEAAMSDYINTIAIVGGAVSGTIGEKKVLSSYAEGLSYFGDSNDFNHLTNMIKLAFQNGARRIIAIKAGVGVTGTPIASADYTTQLDVLQTDESIRFVLVDSSDAAVIAALKTHLVTANTNEKFRRGFVGLGVDATVSARTSLATTTDSKYVQIVAGTLLFGGVKKPEFYTAAMVAGYVASQKSPVINMNYRELVGADGVSGSTSFTKTEQSTLSAGGVTPVILLGGVIQTVRGVTSYLTNGSIADRTYHDIGAIESELKIARDLTYTTLPPYLRGSNDARTRTSIGIAVDTKLAGYDFIEKFFPTVVENDQDEEGSGIIVTVSYLEKKALHHITIVLAKIIS